MGEGGIKRELHEFSNYRYPEHYQTYEVSETS